MTCLSLCISALSAAAKTFYTTVSEAYEPEWEDHTQIAEILEVRTLIYTIHDITSSQ